MNSIGFYRPPIWRAWKVGMDLTDVTRELGYKPLLLGRHRLHKGSWKSENLHADVMRRTPPFDTSDLDWHRDGDITDADMSCLIAVWSTNHPTEIKDSDGTIVTPEPYEIVIFNNKTCYHRRPVDAPYKRWLFRQRLEMK